MKKFLKSTNNCVIVPSTNEKIGTNQINKNGQNWVPLVWNLFKFAWLLFNRKFSYQTKLFISFFFSVLQYNNRKLFEQI